MNRVVVEAGVPMTAADGLTLRADVYRPAGAGSTRWPVLLHRTPYGRHQANYREMAEAIAANGYVVVVQDLRGRFDSEGTFLPMWVDGRLDGADGARAVAWAQTLPGALPLVGMYGVSYDASVQWETAALRPAGLRSIFPGGMVADSRSVWPGVFRVGRQLKWYLMLAADTRRRAGLPPPHTRADSDLLWHFEAGKWIWNLPLADVPADRLGGLAPYWQEWFDRHIEDWYGFAPIAASIPDVAIGLVTGWHDRCLDTVDLFAAATGPGVARTAATELIVGPWTHGYGRPRVVGDVDFGADAETTFVDQAVGLVRAHAATRRRRGGGRRSAAGPAVRHGRECLADVRPLAGAERTARAAPGRSERCSRPRRPIPAAARSSTTRRTPSRRRTRPTTRMRRWISASSTAGRTSSASSSRCSARPSR